MEILIAAIMAFAATNIDDLFINMLLFAQTQTSKEKRSILGGKVLGISILFFTSCIGAGVLASFAAAYTRWLGLLPLAMGIRAWFTRDDDNAETETSIQKLLLSTALITLANGGDNLGVYIPLFSAYSLWQLAAVFGVFVAMTLLWCWAGAKLTDLPLLQSLLHKHKRHMVPVVLIAIGLYILAG